MKKTIIAVLTALLILSMSVASAQAGTLTVQGSASVAAKVDYAVVRVGVRVTNEDVREAQAALNQRINATIAAMEGLGVSKSAISTNSLNIYPEYDYSSATERVVGYTAYTMLSVTTDDIENVGSYVDAAFEAGANTLEGVSFHASNQTEASDQAVALAVQDAARRAGIMAEAAGVQLGALLEIQQGGYASDQPVLRMKTEAAEDDSATQVLAGQAEVSANVTLIYAIEEN